MTNQPDGAATMTAPADAEESIRIELEAIQQERVDFERRQQRIAGDRVKADAEHKQTWQAGLLEINRKHLAATRRLDQAVSSRHRAAAIEASKPKPRIQEPDADGE